MVPNTKSRVHTCVFVCVFQPLSHDTSLDTCTRVPPDMFKSRRDKHSLLETFVGFTGSYTLIYLTSYAYIHYLKIYRFSLLDFDVRSPIYWECLCCNSFFHSTSSNGFRTMVNLFQISLNFLLWCRLPKDP